MLPAPVATPAPVTPPPGPAPLDDARLQGRLWRGSSLGQAVDPTLPSGFAALDAELPGGGWPLQAVTELLLPQPGVLEWRLLAPALGGWWAEPQRPAAGPVRQRAAAPSLRRLLLVNPPHAPHLPGLQALGLPPSALVWVAATTPTEALWAAEQAIKSRVAVLAWLPEARPEQIRRLQVSALGSDAPTFLIRPERAGQQSSAAPLRLAVQPGEGWQLAVHLLKRRGPAHAGWLALPAMPAAIAPLLTAARRRPVPLAAPMPNPAAAERPHALARPVLHA
ncbi:translesion DNA synthesis-associated protein ImuA [Roseateles sp.]|uniref:translesion DNA synthesis-associated protein ImuA n=1 Tax=Roseateles sp. TaxID=1971397 RepID=UPI0025D6D80E|nr:translesion DNA synthesis-associated protein ImuA [Roseateles sp.]MBV8037291.1 translesion DNA synthesis-associated protein ImuA [Roseateles sp.]